MNRRFSFVVFLIFNFYSLGVCSPSRDKRQSRAYGITNFEINESVRRLAMGLKDLENKLNRHELREAEVARFSTKTLNNLNADRPNTKSKLNSIAKQLASMEEKMLSLEALISTTDERQRSKLDGISEGLNRLLIAKPKLEDIGLPPLPKENNNLIERKLRNIFRKVGVIEETVKKDVSKVNNEVKIVGESMRQHMEQLTTLQDRLWNDWNSCQKDQILSLMNVSSSLSQTGSVFTEQMSEAKKLFGKGGKSADCGKLQNEVFERLTALDRAYRDQDRNIEALNHDTHVALKAQKADLETILEESKNEKSLLQNYFSGIIENLNILGSQAKTHLGELETTLKNIVKENSQDLKKRLENISSTLRDKTTNIINALDDAAGMSENLNDGITENFNELSNNIRGLNKVEQVMLNTADAVLDTKRSIEFGIQQVILELSDAVRNSGKNINSTLSDHINNISFAILKNQTSALTNMTKKMENEISQVWRQIGIMYQQIAQSVDILGELKTSTSQHMNASLDKVDTMDGTVGAINNKVADVEDNLNYLLGRLSLVVSEFSQMKTGVGDELEKLRDMAKEFSGDDIVEYQVNRKRSINQGEEHLREHN